MAVRIPALTGAQRWRRRYVVALGLVVAVSALGYVAGHAYINAKWSKAKTVDLALNEGSANFLVLGSDSRAFIDNPQDADSFGAVEGRRADTIIVVRIDPQTGRAILVSFPRDLWVDIPGIGKSRLNAAFGREPQRMIDTLQKNFDIPIHHYLEVDFSGFRNIVNAIGGIEMFVAAPARDEFAGLDVARPGCVSFNGDQALAWVRSRHYKQFEGGRWQTDPTGDFGRIERQQRFIKTLVAQALESASMNPIRGDRLADQALANVTVDDELNAGDVLRLAEVFRSSAPDAIQMQTIPAYVSSHGRQSTVDVDWERAKVTLAKLRGDLPIDGDVEPGQIRVRVLNGVDPRKPLASETSAKLVTLGFQPAGIADAQRTDYQTTEIRYRPGSQEAAEYLRVAIGDRGRLFEDDAITEADIVLIIGRDLVDTESVGRGAARAVQLEFEGVAYVHPGAERISVAADSGC